MSQPLRVASRTSDVAQLAREVGPRAKKARADEQEWTSILALDGGCNPYPDFCVQDPRSPVTVEEVRDVAEEFKAKLVVGMDFPKVKDRALIPGFGHKWKESSLTSSWHVCYDPSTWEVSDLELLEMTQHREAALVKVRRSSKAFCLFLVKVLRGKASTRMHLTHDKRQLIMEKILNTAAQARSEGMSFLAIGDLGMGISGIAQYVIDCDLNSNTVFSQKIDIFMNDNQTMHCLVDGSLETRKLDATQSQRVLILQYGADSTPSDVAQLAGDPSLGSSGGGAAEPHPDLRLISRTSRFLNVLEQPNCDIEGLAGVLFHPVVSKMLLLDHGVVQTGPINIKNTVNMLSDALELIRRARAAAGHPGVSTTLAKHEFETALGFMKATFEKHFMENAALREKVRRYDKDPAQFSRKEKNAIRNNRRGAFNSWAQTLLGGIHFFKAVMRHGLFEISDQRDLAAAVLREKELAGEMGAAAVGRGTEVLRKEAWQARKDLKSAEALQTKIAQGQATILRSHEERLIQRLRSGALHDQAKQANKAYGHGRGSVKPMTTEDAAVLRAFTTEPLRAYYDAP